MNETIENGGDRSNGKNQQNAMPMIATATTTGAIAISIITAAAVKDKRHGLGHGRHGLGGSCWLIFLVLGLLATRGNSRRRVIRVVLHGAVHHGGCCCC